jgi:hypothetical protein
MFKDVVNIRGVRKHMYRLAEKHEIEMMKTLHLLFHWEGSGDLRILHRFILVDTCVCVHNTVCSYANFETDPG